MIDTRKIYHGDCLDILKQLPDESIDCCVTSPPYYGLSGVIENEPTVDAIPVEWIEKWLDEFLGVKLEEEITNLDPFKKNVYQGIFLMYNDWRRGK